MSLRIDYSDILHRLPKSIEAQNLEGAISTTGLAWRVDACVLVVLDQTLSSSPEAGFSICLEPQ